MQPAVFSPTVETLQSMVAVTKTITATDLKDPKQLAKVKEYRLKLRDARTTITKQGKTMRDEAIKYQKDVIAAERDLIAIIEPEEERLKGIEEEAKKLAEREERVKVLPWRKEQIMLIADGQANPNDEELLDMDDTTFNKHVADRKAAKLDAIEAEQREKEQAEQREKEKEEAEERGRQAERDKLAEDKRKAEEEEKAEEERAAKNKKYQAFLKKNGYTEETKGDYKIVREGDTFTPYKVVDTITIK